MVWEKLVVLSMLALVAHGLELPDYIKACKRNDPKLNECALKHAKEGLPFIVKGDKSLNLPSFSPYHLPEISIESGNNLKIKFTDCVLSGLENVVLEKGDINLDKLHLVLDGSLDRINLAATYDITGNILVLPISGHGPSNITVDGITFQYLLNLELEKRADNKEYLKMKSSDLLFNVTRGYYQFDNLFQGDARLGAEMNKFLNENHKEVGVEFNPAIAEIVKTIINRLMETFVTKVEYEKLFPL